MSSPFAMRFDMGDVLAGFDRLEAGAQTAIRRALSRTAVSVRVAMARAMSDDTGLKVGTIRDRLRVEIVDHADPVARISVSGARIPLIEFGARGPEPSRGRGRGVTARLTGGAGRYPHAFIATMRSGHRGVFQRRGTTRLPIYELRGPSLPKVFTKYIPLGLARGEEQLAKNLEHELQFALSRSTAA